MPEFGLYFYSIYSKHIGYLAWKESHLKNQTITSFTMKLCSLRFTSTLGTKLCHCCQFSLEIFPLVYKVFSVRCAYTNGLTCVCF